MLLHMCMMPRILHATITPQTAAACAYDSQNAACMLLLKNTAPHGYDAPKLLQHVPMPPKMLHAPIVAEKCKIHLPKNVAHICNTPNC